MVTEGKTMACTTCTPSGDILGLARTASCHEPQSEVCCWYTHHAWVRHHGTTLRILYLREDIEPREKKGKGRPQKGLWIKAEEPQNYKVVMLPPASCLMQGLPRNAKATGWKVAEEQYRHSSTAQVTYQYKARREVLQQRQREKPDTDHMLQFRSNNNGTNWHH